MLGRQRRPAESAAGAPSRCSSRCRRCISPRSPAAGPHRGAGALQGPAMTLSGVAPRRTRARCSASPRSQSSSAPTGLMVVMRRISSSGEFTCGVDGDDQVAGPQPGLHAGPPPRLRDLHAERRRRAGVLGVLDQPLLDADPRKPAARRRSAASRPPARGGRRPGPRRCCPRAGARRQRVGGLDLAEPADTTPSSARARRPPPAELPG